MEAPKLHDADGTGGLLSGPALSLRDYRRLSAFIEANTGIRTPPAKMPLIESRLRSRLMELGMESFSEYCDHLFAPSSVEERVRVIDRITTNKTDFFREPAHFSILTQQAIPALAARDGAGRRRSLRVWSAGCATGEEPYTLAMVLSEEAERAPGFRFQILGTDLSTRVLRHARAGIYREAQVGPVPVALRQKYFLRSVADQEEVRIRKTMRQQVELRQLNLLDRSYELHPPMDVVFCRNVFIYFERATQSAILSRFAASMTPGGYLFLGHSETITDAEVPFELVGPTVWRLRESAR